MLLSMVPASDSILPPGPNDNLAPQPGHQSRVYASAIAENQRFLACDLFSTSDSHADINKSRFLSPEIA